MLLEAPCFQRSGGAFGGVDNGKGDTIVAATSLKVWISFIPLRSFSSLETFFVNLLALFLVSLPHID